MNEKLIRLLAALLSFVVALWAVLEFNTTGVKNVEVPAVLKASFAYQAEKWLNDMRAFPSEHIPVHWKENALRQLSDQKSSYDQVSSTASQLSWTSLGPSNYGGRLRSIVIDPQHPDTMYVGSVSGGIWKTTNGGTSWFETSDLAANMCIGTMVMDPTNSNIIYAGTGEGYFNIDALRGAGVLKSTNGGTSWSLLTNFATANSRYSYYYINKLVIRPNNPSVLYAAMIGGIWKSTDAGASWAKLNVPSSSVFCMDLVECPTTPDTLYASFGLFMPDNDGIYKTTDGGTTWAKLVNGLPDISLGYTRISLAIAPSSPNVVYAQMADSLYYTFGIYKTSDGGQNWFGCTTPYDNSSYVRNTHLGGQGFYNNVIAVSPQSPTTVYAGGINMFKSTNAGTGWTRIIDGNGTPNFHVDQHVVTFSPTSANTIFFGNDGGIYKTTDAGTTFSTLNNNLTVAQFYYGAIHPTQNIYFGGTQDNGTLISSVVPGWYQLLAGDGGPVLVDYQNPDNVYLSYVYLTVYKSTNGGYGASRSMSGIPTAPNQQWVADRCSFIAPLVMDPSNPQVLLGGTYRLFKSSNGAGSWTTLTADLTGGGSGTVGMDGPTITAIAIAKSNSSVIYVGTSGWTGIHSRVTISTDAGSTWNYSASAPLPNREVSSIAVDMANASRALVTYSGFNTNTPSTPGHIFLTTNGGFSWANVTGNLPDVPVNSVVIDSRQVNHFIAGTDLGVFETQNGGANWSQQNDGMANVAVFDVHLRNDGYVLAATHGRGMFVSSSDIYSGLGLLYPPISDSTIGSSVTFRWKHSDSTSVFRLTVGTNPEFTTGVFMSDTSITDTTKTITGLTLNQTYYWQIGYRKTTGSISSSPIWDFSTVGSYPSSFSVQGIAVFPFFNDPGSYTPSQYRLVGFPGGSNFPVDSIISGAHNTEWQLYWDNGAATNYMVEYNGTPDFKFSEGRAFWLVHKGNWNFNVTVPSVPLDSQAVKIPLHAGWNIITNPYPFTITWQTVQHANSLTDLLWGFNGGFSSSTSLVPSQGYYFFNTNNLSTLTIPYGNTAGKVTAASTFQWKVGIGLQANGDSDQSASFGVSTQALSGLDKFDARRPRAVGDLPAIIFSRPEWDSSYSAFATDYRPVITGSEVWKVTAHTKSGVSATLSLSGISSIPKTFDVYLIDVERGTSQNLRSDSTYTYLSSSTDMPFEVLVGSSEAVKQRLSDLTPLTYFLSNNYPNPFNPSTNFEYRLPQASYVSFKIYNMLGQEVADLVNEHQNPGVYSISWNAGNVSSGVYLARLNAGEFTSTKKLLLIK